ncbi:hypothetical protein CONPUDRAFT_139291 [Coniophora puteana RWD-64-598 SS2]|uniref:Uncharacterized protein n=1 Tax=Coniophora puteana (strain RWD-64-598) TaxID=741705 RepID=A0A5M3MDS5_CONPW|nr:uncharacterized protein CONPUDRAFT_139291 [Coniophora puteana RWD-64-598 SS2]EIW77378.1 hypothetical protein CONPUDRAFT_139291 [Coniophora puteana RWD-64-598 SS2]
MGPNADILVRKHTYHTGRSLECTRTGNHIYRVESFKLVLYLTLSVLSKRPGKGPG